MKIKFLNFKKIKEYWYIPTGIVVAIIVVILSFVVFRQLKNIEAAGWYNNDWHYRQQFDVFNASTTQNLIDFQVRISTSTLNLVSLSSNNKTKTDFSDLRFTDINGNLLEYWFSDNTENMGAVYVKFPSLPNNATSTLYMYYGNPGSDDDRKNGRNFFEFFDDFSDNEYTSSNWDQSIATGLSCTYTQAGGIYQINNSNSGACNFVAPDVGLNNYTVEAQTQHVGITGASMGLIVRSDLNGNYYHQELDQSKLYLYRFTDWAYFQLGVSSSLTMQADKWYEVRYKVSGSSLEGHTYTHDTTVSGSDASFASGRPGLQTWSNNAKFDDFLVRKYAQTEPNVVVTAGTAEEVGGGPMAYWRFDTGYGTTAYDTTANNNNGTFNDITWTPPEDCISNNCVTFDASDDYLTLADSNSLNIATNLTISGWIKIKGAAGGSTGTYHPIISYLSTDSATGYQFFIADSDYASCNSKENELGIYINGLSCSNYSLGTNQWHHVAVTLAGTTHKFYIDGKLVETVAGNSLTQYSSFSSGNGIGKWGTAQYFNGLMDELKVFNYTLSDGEVKQEYQAGKTGLAGVQGISAGFGAAVLASSTGPVAYWSIDEANGTALYDKSGNENNSTSFDGSLGSAEDWVLGKKGTALYFDGLDDTVKVPDSSTLDGDGAWTGQTMSMWIYPKTDNQSATIFLSKRNDGTTSSYQVGFDGSGNSQIFCGYYLSAAYQETPYTDSPVLQKNRWYHVACTFESGVGVKFYLDGILAGIQNYATSATVRASASIPVRLGSRGNSGANQRFFNGILDELKIYNRTLTAEEIANEYNNGLPKVHWDFNEGQGTTVYGDNLQEYNGTLTNMSTSGTSTAWVIGKEKQALMFDGIDDTISVTDKTDSYLDLANGGSISAWIKPFSLSGNQYIVDKDQTSAYSMMLNNDVLVGYFDVAGSNSCSGGTLQENIWQHIAITNNGAYLRCYIDGKLVGETADTGPIDTQNTSLYIGSDGGVANYFNGLIDEVKIYSYALSSNSLQNEINFSKAAVLSTADGGRQLQQGLIGWWPMDESTTAWDGAGDRVNDYSGNNHHGTSYDNAHATTTAKYGNAGEFDGSGDYIDLGNISEINGAKQFTISVWANLRSGSNFPLVAKYGGDSNNRTHIWPALSTIYWNISNSSTSYAESAVAAAGWHQYVMVFDGTRVGNSNRLKAFIDGEEVKLSFTGDIPSSATNESGNLMIANSAGTYANALIDDIKIYNFPLSQNLITMDYLEGSSVLAYWNFDEGTGTSLADISGQGNNSSSFSGSLGAIEDWVSGKKGWALDFDGSDDYVDMGNILNMDRNSFTVSAWVKTDDASIDGWYRRIYGKGWSGDGYTIYIFTDGTLQYISNSTGSNSTNATINDNQWHHITTVRDKTNIKIYIDGVLDLNQTNANWGADLDNNESFTIGVLTDGGTTQGHWNGQIDEVKVFNYALTPSQIAQEYNNGKPVGYWKFDEGELGTIYDWSGNENNGLMSLNGSPATSTAWQTSSNCQLNSCLDFDGVDDTVYIADFTNSTLDITEAITLSAWIYPTTVTGDQYIIDKDQTSAYSLMISGSTLYGYFDIGGSNSCSGGNISVNTWQHVAAVYDGNNIKCYLNGSLVNKTADSGSIDVQDTALYIGSDGGAANYFKGRIDEIKINNYGRSAEQIKEDVNLGYGTYFK